jgi:phosphoribosylformylglycinamidine synthase II
MIDPHVYREMGLTDEEYAQILELVGREPSETELGMFAVMWSEHCGYKYSRPVLQLFKKYKEALEGDGFENAGIVDIGDGLGITMKVESHNHPSAVEPLAGAATGVGGIIRDIFTMGARPIASLNSLRFGPLDDPHNRYLFAHVVEGIASYGNCVGVPTVAGEVYFHPSYSGNPLVNAMAVGVVELDKIASAKSEGVGNAVMYVGSSTGKDGIHGATFASTALDEDNESKRPNVQIGDPFAEKLLIEATLEALRTGEVVGIQDMGAAGLTCSTCEMSSKSGMGMDVDIALVPRREQGMTPYEVMLSESQERMLAVVRTGSEDKIIDIFKKWELNAVVIGHVTDDGIVRIRDNGKMAAEVQARHLTDKCPTYELEAEEPAYIAEKRSFDLSTVPQPEDYGAALLKILDSTSVGSKSWVYQQYDHMVQTQTVVPPGKGDAAVLRIRGTKTKGIALKIDCNARYCYLDPFVGAQIAVAETARNLACVGATPKAVTDCLNFGNPQKPHVFWQFKRAVEGLASACEFFDTPVISGNVSFYNETDQGEVFPTPSIGMLGLLDDVSKHVGAGFPDEANVSIWLVQPQQIKDPHEGLGGSEYLAAVHGLETGQPPSLDMEAEKAVQSCVIQAIQKGLLRSAHDCSDGGFAVAMAECCLIGGVGATVSDGQSMIWIEQTTKSGTHYSRPFAPGQEWAKRQDAALFGEVQSRILVTVKEGPDVDAFETLAIEAGVEPVKIGMVGGDRLTIYSGSKRVLSLNLEEMNQRWAQTIESKMS